MIGYWKQPTRIGEARIVPTARGWRIEVGGEVLGGGYRSAQSALDDLAS